MPAATNQQVETAPASAVWWRICIMSIIPARDDGSSKTPAMGSEHDDALLTDGDMRLTRKSLLTPKAA
jgi:hypothetical protein